MIQEIIERVKGLILAPAQEWAKISKEKNEVMPLLIKWVLPLLAITLVAIIIGSGLVARFSIFSFGIASGIVAVIIALVMLFVLALLANILAPKYGGKDDFNRSFALVVFSMVPQWVAGVFYIIPGIGSLLVWIASLYGLYILYLGVQPMKSVPKANALTYFIILIVVWVIVAILLSVVLLMPLTILVLKTFDPAAAAALSVISAFSGF